jgi:hypothetical protein
MPDRDPVAHRRSMLKAKLHRATVTHAGLAQWTPSPPAQATPDRGKAVRLVVVFLLLACVLGFVFFVLPRLAGGGGALP